MKPPTIGGDGTHGLHCTRCGVEDDSIVLDPEGGPDLCAVCASDADEREDCDCADPDCDDDHPGEEDDSAVWRCASCSCICGEHSCCHRPSDEHAPAPDSPSRGAGAAASPAGPVPSVGRFGGAALDGVYLLGDGERVALADARALLVSLSEMDPCPDCGGTLDEREEEPDELRLTLLAEAAEGGEG